MFFLPAEMFYLKNYQNYFYLIISQYLNGMLIFQQILFQNILKAEQIVLRMFVSKSDIFTVFVDYNVWKLLKTNHIPTMVQAFLGGFI